MGTGNFIRYGEQGAGNTIADYFSLQYNGNQLTGIFDYSGTQNSYNIKEYQDKNHIYGATNEMDYDANGNMTKDLDRNIVTIKYNLLNLPEIIQFGNGNQIRNTYDAGGQKLKTVYSTLGTPIVVPINNIGNLGDPNNCSDFIHGTDYVGNIEYSFSNDCGDYQHDLSMIYNTEGYVTGLFVNTGPNYQYFRKDHLGNNREVWNATTNTTVQRTHYYPSGLPWNSTTGIGASVQNKKYNGKEFIEMHGLDITDLGNRGLYHTTNRFTSIDRFAEKYPWQSPYVFAANNPVNYIDVNGDSIWFTYQYDRNNQLSGVTMHVKGKVINVSNNDVDMDFATEEISNQIESSFQGEVEGIKFNTDVQLSSVKSMKEVDKSDHVFALAEISSLGEKTIPGAVNQLGGKVAFVDADYFTGAWDRYIGGVGKAEAAHEFGHLVGLQHVGYSNLMKQGAVNNWFRYSTSISSEQLNKIYQNRMNINLGENFEYIHVVSPSAGGLILVKKPNRGSQVKSLINY